MGCWLWLCWHVRCNVYLILQMKELHRVRAHAQALHPSTCRILSVVACASVCMCMQAFTKILPHASITWMHMLHCLFPVRSILSGVGKGCLAASRGHSYRLWRGRRARKPWNSGKLNEKLDELASMSNASQDKRLASVSTSDGVDERDVRVSITPFEMAAAIHEMTLRGLRC